MREAFHQINCEESLNTFISEYESSGLTEVVPYMAAATMRKAEYCVWPGSKLGYFSNGKEELEAFISENPEDIEGRYVRALVQSQLPSFLGYSEDLVSDCEFVKAHLSQSGLSPDYQSRMLKEISSILNAR